jgi:2-keto-4-pentenoate hydratase/2-oxohepta-3-ene-1,7-dioic acid hydratase in catechol pathway
VPTQLYLATIAAGDAGPAVAAVSDGRAHPLANVSSIRSALGDWDSLLDSATADLDAGRLGDGIPVDEVSFLPPLPNPANLYMAGANYADHTREMRKLPPGTPIDRPPAGPFFFLKPTSTLTGHRTQVVRPAPIKRLDWEVELAAIIGRTAHHVAEANALDHVAGYTVVNDVSARDGFIRQGSEEAMTFDWLGQKGWHTTCPAGPWLVAARDCPDPQSLSLRLTVGDELMQDSSTSEMLFSLAEQIAYLSRIVPLVAGDMICTGTCAGVGAGRGRFLQPGEIMRAEIGGIGALENTVVDE